MLRAWTAPEARAFLVGVDNDPNGARWRLLPDALLRIGEALVLGWATVRVWPTLTCDEGGGA